jgi:putative tricarboxylic transport membrane protein
MFLAPTLASFALKFGPPEYSALLMLGLLMLAYMTGGSMPKTLAMAGLGLVLGMIGIDAMSGYTRFGFDVVELSDGVGIVPVAVGLFGISEILMTASQELPPLPKNPTLRELMPTKQDFKDSYGAIGRGSLLGFFIGIIPGSAHIISSFISYGIERRISKTPERFGHGAIAGVAGPESANNAAATGAFIPMMALGIPTSPVTAVMLAAIMVHGITPGPMLISERPDLFWGFVASMYVGNLMLLILNLPLVGLFVRLLRIPYSYLYPCILAFCILGCYSVSNSVVDVWIMLSMGGIAFVLDREGRFSERVNYEMVDLEVPDDDDRQWLTGLLTRFVAATGSQVANDLLAQSDPFAHLIKVMPRDYRKVLEQARQSIADAAKQLEEGVRG